MRLTLGDGLGEVDEVLFDLGGLGGDGGAGALSEGGGPGLEREQSAVDDLLGRARSLTSDSSS